MECCCQTFVSMKKLDHSYKCCTLFIFSGSYNHSIASAILLNMTIEDTSDSVLANVSISVCESLGGGTECVSYLEIELQPLNKPNCTKSRRKRNVNGIQERQTRKKRYLLSLIGLFRAMLWSFLQLSWLNLF